MLPSQLIKNYQAIAKMDPLGLDSELSTLAKTNANKDSNSLHEFMVKGISRAEKIDFDNLDVCHAVLRDLGFIMSSLRKLDVQVCQEYPRLEQILLKLASKTGTVPRESSYHYGICNPDDQRQRTFTDYPDEHGLINGVRIFALGLEKTLCSILEIYEQSSQGIRIKESQAEKILAQFTTSLKEAGGAMRKIDPLIFSTKLRPFFDPITIDGKAYVGPGGGQVPLLVIDSVLFAFDLKDDHVYRLFSEEGYRFLTKELVETYEVYKSKPTLLELAMNNEDLVLKSFLGEFFNELIKYRQVHYQVAKNALSERNRGDYETGSAGYRLEMVLETLSATKNARRRILQK